MSSVVYNHRIVAIAPELAPLLFGLNSSAIYVGVAIGSVLGGFSQSWLSITLLGILAAVMALLATLVIIIERRRSQCVEGGVGSDRVPRLGLIDHSFLLIVVGRPLSLTIVTKERVCVRQAV